MDACPPPPDGLDAQPDLFGEALAELVTIGMDVARTIQFLAHAEASKAADAPAGTPAQAAAHLAAAIDGVARAIRRTALLARHLDNPASPSSPRRTVIRRRIAREVQDTIRRRETDPQNQANLETELRERLENPDLDLEIDHRTPKEIIQDICRDLGVASSAYIRRTPADIAALAALATPPDPLFAPIIRSPANTQVVHGPPSPQTTEARQAPARRPPLPKNARRY